jgi:hypothetical protein
MSRRERYIARQSNPSNVGNYDIDQLYNKLAPSYGDVEKFSLTPVTPSPRQLPFKFEEPDGYVGDVRALDLDIETVPLRRGDYGYLKYPDQFEGYIPKKDFPDVLRQDTDPESLLYHLGDFRDMGKLDFQGGIMEAFPEEGMTPGRDFEGAPNIPHISEYMDYFNTLSPREVQGLGSIFKKMYRDAAIDKKLYDFYNA